jgi:hypothetical protein
MADNPTVDNGALTDYVVAADDVGSGVLVQRVRLDVGAEGASSPVNESSGSVGKLPVVVPDRTAAGTVDMASTANASAAFPLEGLGAVSVTVSGTWTGTLVIEFEDNAGAWQLGPNIYPLDPLTNTYNVFIDFASGGATQHWKVIGTAGMQAVRLRCYATGTGTATVNWRGSYAPYDFITAAVSGDVNHDGTDSGGPLKVGQKAIAFGANPTAVAAADRSNWYANRHGIPFVLGGHMNPFRLTRKDTAAQTDTVLQAVSAGQKAVITAVSVYVDHACSVDVQALVEFDDTADVRIFEHPGIAPGSGAVEGNGGGILAAGADGQDVLWTCEVPTSGSVVVHVTGFLIES